jgi:hypothetical protein
MHKKKVVYNGFLTVYHEIDNYNSVREYLSSFGKTIHQTGEKGSRKKTSHKWFETQDNIAFWQDFLKPKLV